MLRDSFFCRSFLSLIISILVSQPLLLNYSHNTCSLNLTLSFNLTCLFEVGQEACCKICKFNLQECFSLYKNNPQALEIATALLHVKEGYQPNEPPSCHNQQDSPLIFFPQFAQRLIPHSTITHSTITHSTITHSTITTK